MHLVTITQVEREYPDEWVLLEVVRDHKDHSRIAGRLLAHSSDRSELNDPYRRYRASHPYARLYEFYTGDVVAEGYAAAL